jgi:NAD(P)-dependent dehydrogenase (short-subunit alcohol dehydrogenase family)
MFSLDFTKRHVVVTGGTGALGTAVVQVLLDAGAVCHVPAIEHAVPHHFPQALANNERVRVTCGVELTDEAAVTDYYAKLPALWGSIHVAGGFDMAPIAEMKLAHWQHMMDMNGTTCFLCCREAVRKIRATKDAAGGRIVNVAARPALIPTSGMVAYSASKAAVANLTTSLAEELAAERIWVNAVVPSIMDTPANRKAMPKAEFDKWPKVQEVAATIAFLASPQNALTRGGLIPVYGQS